jgi:hypothetical protein
VHPSAEHDFLYFFPSTFLEACSLSFVDDSRFLLIEELLRAAAEAARVEVARDEVKET